MRSLIVALGFAILAGSAGAHPSSGKCATIDIYHKGPSFGYVFTKMDVENHCPHKIDFLWKVRGGGTNDRYYSSRSIPANGSDTIEIGQDESGNVPSYNVRYCDEYPTRELRRAHSAGRCER